MASSPSGEMTAPSAGTRWRDFARRTPLLRLPASFVLLLAAALIGIYAIAVCLAVAVVLLVLTARTVRWIPMQPRTARPIA